MISLGETHEKMKKKKTYNNALDCRVGLSKPKINVNIWIHDYMFLSLHAFALCTQSSVTRLTLFLHEFNAV